LSKNLFFSAAAAERTGMRPPPLVLLLTAIFVAGCARQSVNCTMGAGRNCCVPVTKE